MHLKEAKGILLSRNHLNLYRGCTHGCIYCDSRSTCYDMKHDFEDIEVKINATQLLEIALAKKRNKCIIGTGSMCDPYMHTEKEFKLMQQSLLLIKKYDFGVNIHTKSDLVLRDLELLKSINDSTKCVVQMSVGIYDEDICKKVEQSVCSTKMRFEAMKILSNNGIPTIAWLCPILPYITDTEENIKGIVNSCAEAGVSGIIYFGAGLTLRDGNRQHFYKNLDKHFPGIKEKYIKDFGNAYSIKSKNSRQLDLLFYNECKKHNIKCNINELFEFSGTYETKNAVKQMSLF